VWELPIEGKKLRMELLVVYLINASSDVGAME
jgi:hypothetical protein